MFRKFNEVGLSDMFNFLILRKVCALADKEDDGKAEDNLQRENNPVGDGKIFEKIDAENDYNGDSIRGRNIFNLHPRTITQ